MDSITDADRPKHLTSAEFRAFLTSRPVRERWKLVRCVPTKLERPTLANGIVAANFEHLLLDALEDHDPSLLAVQRAGLELEPGDHYLEPVVSVIDADYRVDQYAVGRAYFVAEFVSDAEALVSGGGQRRIELKRELLHGHEYCRAIALVRENRMEASSTSGIADAGRRRFYGTPTPSCRSHR